MNELFTIGRQLGYPDQFPSNPEIASIIDDHRAFVDIGIPSADLIINFWSNPDWPYHHTIEDDISHISELSLEITGKTVEQFIYNNFHNESLDLYQGNYPWNQDLNVPNIDVIIVIIVIFSVIGIVVLIHYSTKKISKKETENIRA